MWEPVEIVMESLLLPSSPLTPTSPPARPGAEVSVVLGTPWPCPQGGPRSEAAAERLSAEVVFVVTAVGLGPLCPFCTLWL